jgi:RNA polymerase sigma factor (sigma-70 family)
VHVSRRARFGELYRMRPRVVDFVRSRGAWRWSVDDVVAETYVVAWRRIEVVPAADDAALSWLCGVARLTLANLQRSHRRAAALAERLSVHFRHPGVADASARSLSVEAWQSLSEQDQLLLQLVAWHGADLSEVAELLRCSPAAAATRLSRARARLAARMNARMM